MRDRGPGAAAIARHLDLVIGDRRAAVAARQLPGKGEGRGGDACGGEGLRGTGETGKGGEGAAEAVTGTSLT